MSKARCIEVIVKCWGWKSAKSEHYADIWPWLLPVYSLSTNSLAWPAQYPQVLLYVVPQCWVHHWDPLILLQSLFPTEFWSRLIGMCCWRTAVLLYRNKTSIGIQSRTAEITWIQTFLKFFLNWNWSIILLHYQSQSCLPILNVHITPEL